MRLRFKSGDVWFASKNLRKYPHGSRALFLDLDGTLWEDKGPGSILDFEISSSTTSKLKSLAGEWLKIGFSNQTFIGRRKYFSPKTILRYWKALDELLKEEILDAIAICHHHPDAANFYLRRDCESRKPKSGLVCWAVDLTGIDVTNSVAIGDKITDIVAANTAGVKSNFLISNPSAFKINKTDLKLDSAYAFQFVDRFESLFYEKDFREDLGENN